MRPKAVVIGSGMSGGTVARLLALTKDWDVVILEKGQNFFSGLGTVKSSTGTDGFGQSLVVSNIFPNDEVGWEYRIPPINQDPILEPRSFRTDPSSGKRTFVGNVQFLPTTVGGGTVHFDAKFRRFREVDFVTNSLMGGTADKPAIPNTTYTDWPLEYRHIEPFYAVCEEILGVQGPARRLGNGVVYNPNPYESPRSTPFPMPPGVDMLSSFLPAEAASRLGYTPAPVPTAVNSRPYRGRSACVDCGYCLNYGCPINAKSSGAWPINDALATGRAQLITEANVVRIEHTMGPNGRYQASAIKYIDGDGNAQWIQLNPGNGDVVVLANTPIEATRLSIRSEISNPPNESNLSALQPSATEPSGLLGRNLMFHLQTTAIAIFDREIHSPRGRTSTQTLDAFCGSGPGKEGFDPTVPRGGIVEIGGNQNPVTQANDIGGVMFGEAHKQYMELGPFVKRITAFTMQGEDMPQVTNCVDLDPDIVDVFGEPVPRITYKSHPYELAASAYYAPKLQEILETIGAPGSKYDIHPVFVATINTTIPPVMPGTVDQAGSQVMGATPFSEIPASQHIMGTHRMALDREHGPCDPFGRYWAFDNLYHAGGGLYCTAAGFNVTLTMAALSYRVAAAIASKVPIQDSYTIADIDGLQSRMESVITALDKDTMIAKYLLSP
jgi:choline dehydrogenase-like flavoprotein